MIRLTGGRERVLGATRHFAEPAGDLVVGAQSARRRDRHGADSERGRRTDAAAADRLADHLNQVHFRRRRLFSVRSGLFSRGRHHHGRVRLRVRMLFVLSSMRLLTSCVFTRLIASPFRNKVIKTLSFVFYV